MLINRKHRKEGSKLPWGYGVAYRDWYTCHDVCYPVPINILVRLYKGIEYFYYKYIGYPQRWLFAKMESKEYQEYKQLRCFLRPVERSRGKARTLGTTFEDADIYAIVDPAAK